MTYIDGLMRFRVHRCRLFLHRTGTAGIYRRKRDEREDGDRPGNGVDCQPPPEGGLICGIETLIVSGNLTPCHLIPPIQPELPLSFRMMFKVCRPVGSYVAFESLDR